MKKKAITVIIILGAILAAYGYYLYNKPVSSLDRQNAVYSLNAITLLSEYESDEQSANTNYLDKVIEVTGEIDKIEYTNGKTSIYLLTDNPMSSIICEMEEGNTIIKSKKADKLTIKGLCTGYLMDVVLVRCLIN